MYRVHKLRTRRLIALCASLRVSALFQHQSAPPDRSYDVGGITLTAPFLTISRLSFSLYPTAHPHLSYVRTINGCLHWRRMFPSQGFLSLFWTSHSSSIGVQVMIAVSAMRAVKILTWSSSPFDLTAALVHHTQLTPATFLCMRRVSDLDTDGCPTKPTETRPSTCAP
ncbi:uncharacterized protein F5891DRAFT_25563 [Suillus fuscotomentosus]|uniref:Secreted protein n=1 Tax=Suillus fuscotomentosus TaxID=1912939 RepID=A0AAD4HUC6_9AGAM|nr:uncharacterized protein F5891DRAFT_25563 [Suillus fuscotomentosus]KAG1908742.1 hypothetical protein F5891DRAFT_25563 [Suillus fuscotomentosus]